MSGNPTNQAQATLGGWCAYTSCYSGRGSKASAIESAVLRMRLLTVPGPVNFQTVGRSWLMSLQPRRAANAVQIQCPRSPFLFSRCFLAKLDVSVPRLADIPSMWIYGEMFTAYVSSISTEILLN